MYDNIYIYNIHSVTIESQNYRYIFIILPSNIAMVFAARSCAWVLDRDDGSSALAIRVKQLDGLRVIIDVNTLYIYICMQYMDYIWIIYGIYMEYIWNIYGIYMEYIWNI